jgi:hypothetical protein
MVSLGNFLVHSQSLVSHLPHDLLSFLIFEFIKLISFLFFSATSLFLSLLFLLHDDLVSDHLLEDDIVQNVAKEFVLHSNYICLN